ncbi:hypothetical protein [Desulfofustis limnaeus]|jgi:protein-tyrosine phosphatase|uniref:protein-tyrosine-phosphatase n=1 Tax=Desulfofustis limnaeus TaxID=2740163 RepID=A0ABM7W9M6_9BACT|nr:hypothetical protein [Desulfofustis limnaeus]BDD87631.1 hypothetical protein DPPLL_19960 [Desulfofustis limnaeus]
MKTSNHPQASKRRAVSTVGRAIAAVRRRIEHRVVLRGAREQSRAAVEQATGRRILVLCYGNIYRSPLVHHLLRHDPRLADFSIESAGFYPLAGRPCDSRYLELLRRRGHDLQAHRSALVDRRRLAEADMVVIMDRRNWDLLRELDAAACRKVVWIGAFGAGGSVEVEDPYGKSESEVEAIIERLEGCAEELAGWIAGGGALK